MGEVPLGQPDPTDQLAQTRFLAIHEDPHSVNATGEPVHAEKTKLFVGPRDEGDTENTGGGGLQNVAFARSLQQPKLNLLMAVAENAHECLSARD
jgi:hypothetical protein